MVISKYSFPGYTVGIGSKGCVTFSPERITDYTTFKANQDAELCERCADNLRALWVVGPGQAILRSKARTFDC